MCYIWKNPTHPEHEVSVSTLSKLPDGFDYLNITGGEPTLREDLQEIVDELHPRARTLEISTNGLHGDKLLPLVKKYPGLKVRISLEGFEFLNDRIRGEEGGYEKKIRAMNQLIEAGGTDLGFATTFQDENVDQIVDLYLYSKRLRIEFATSALHNAFQFHKNDNYIYDRVRTARKVEGLITEMLRSWRVKDWFRAYLNLGLIAKILGHDRLIPCTAGTDFIFVDPWSDVYACNVRPDLLMGNLGRQSWSDIFEGDVAQEKRRAVAQCPQNCWMVASAKTVMRNKHAASLPTMNVLSWVVLNKLRALLRLPIPYEKYVDYAIVQHDDHVVERTSYLGKPEKRLLQPERSRHYSQFGTFFNR